MVPIKYNSNNAVSKGTYFYFQATIDPDSTLAKSQYIKANISFETEDGTKYNETIDFAQSQSDNFLLGIHASNKTAIINGSTVNYTEYYFRAHTTTKFYNVKVILSLNPAVNTNFVTYTGYKNPFENLDYADQSYIGQLTESDLKVVFENIINELQYTESTLMPNTYMTFSDTIGEKFDINSNIKITLNKKDYNFTNNNGIYKCNASSILWSDETREITTDDIIISIKNKILEIKLPSEIIPIIGTNIIPIRIQYTLELNNIESGTYYTNDSAFATFTPYNSNEYYKKLSEKITAKTVNNTETETFVKKSSISNELATDFLGNNGKIVIAIEKLTITKIWDDENNKYETRPETLNITLLQNETVYKTYTLNSTNALETDENKWQITNIKVPKYDSNGNEYIYTIQEDENNFNLLYYYQNPIYNQDTLTVTNTAVWLEVKDDSIPEYRIAIVKEIINDSGSIANSDDFAKIKLDSTATYNFPIVLKQLNTVLSKGETSMLEDYEGYSGNIYNGIVTNKGNLVFNNIPAGKYEISEESVQYFDFVNFDKISSSTGASLTYEDGKYYITISGITTTDEDIEVKVTNKIEDERYYEHTSWNDNLFKIFKSSDEEDPEEAI